MASPNEQGPAGPDSASAEKATATTTGEAPKPGEAKKNKILGDYELIGKLGQGAMGAVYLARQISKDRHVALKILPPQLAKDQEFLERFRREARAATKLQHPNIVAALDVGIADNYHYIAMEYVEGADLESMLKKRGRFKEQDLLRIAADVAQALQAAEEKGIVHRDIKPANVLMNSERVSKLTDMGLSSASAGDQRVTMAGYAVGTPYYLSPEQARGEPNVDTRADIYSLGATLYHLATGTVPYPGNNPVVIMTQHINEPLQPPHQREPSVPQHVSQLIMKMMAKDPLHRPQNARELLVDIERCKKGEPPVPHNALDKTVPAMARQKSNSPQPATGAMFVGGPDRPASTGPAGLPAWVLPVVIIVGSLAALALVAILVTLFRR